MPTNESDPLDDGPVDETHDGAGGDDVDDGSRLTAFTVAVATLADIQARRAVFALDDTERPWPIDMQLPSR